MSERSAAAKRPLIVRFPVREQIVFSKRLAMILRSGVEESAHVVVQPTKCSDASLGLTRNDVTLTPRMTSGSVSSPTVSVLGMTSFSARVRTASG